MVGTGLETSDCLEPCTLWPASNAVADAFGNQRIGKACSIMTGWAFRSNLSADPKSGAVSIVAKVTVDQEVALGSIIFKGKLGTYKAGDQLYQVVGYNEAKDVYDEVSRRIVMLALWNTSLPEGA